MRALSPNRNVTLGLKVAISHTVIRSLIPSALRNACELRFLPSPFELTLLEKVGLDR
jgi:hypothetical protein